MLYANRPLVFAIFYSPGLGPIPFTLASESFPLTHREAVRRVWSEKCDKDSTLTRYREPHGQCPLTLVRQVFWPCSIQGKLLTLAPKCDPTDTLFRIAKKMTDAGSLGFFAFLNLIAFVLVFLLVEETKRRSLEDLDLVFAVSKRRFMSFNVKQYGPWWIKRHFMGQREAQPELCKSYNHRYNSLVC